MAEAIVFWLDASFVFVLLNISLSNEYLGFRTVSDECRQTSVRRVREECKQYESAAAVQRQQFESGQQQYRRQQFECRTAAVQSWQQQHRR